MGIFQLKLNLSATLLNEVKEQQVRKVLQFIVTRVRTQVQDLGYRRGSSSIIGPASLIAESSVVPQCPKGRGMPVSTEKDSLVCHIVALNSLLLQWLTSGMSLVGCGNTLCMPEFYWSARLG